MLSWRMARRMSGSTVAAAVTLALLVPVPAHADGTVVSVGAPGTVPAPTQPVEVKTTTVPAVTPTESPSTPDKPSRVVAELDQTETAPFRMIGVTWSTDTSSTDITVEVRTRTAKTWSAWTSLEVDDDEDTGTPGTEPLWVGNADGVAARVTSAHGTPEDVKITTIDPGAAEASTNATSAVWSDSPDEAPDVEEVATSTDGSPAYTPQPSIITRSSWGAASGTKCDTPLAGDRTRGVVVHHTAGSNTYSKGDSKSIVRATQAYHMKARNWCDIGYNFLVDKYGQIFEGRAGGVDRAVRAAHSGNLAVNTYTMGVSMMGDYDKVKPTTALKDAMVKLVGWRMGTNYLPAKGTYSLGGKTLNMIAGHRNVISTACPGKYGYAWLSEKGGLRDRVETYIAKYSTPAKTLWKSVGTAKFGGIFIGESKSSTGSRLWGKSAEILAGNGLAAEMVSGAYLTAYNAAGSRTGTLGYPRSTTATVSGGGRQLFQRGRIFLPAGKSKAYSVVGDISTMYASLAEMGGVLGAPTSSTTVKSGVSKVTFAKGYITSSGGKTTAYSSSGKVIKASTTAPPAATKPATVRGISVSAGKHSARLRWSAASGAKSYSVCVMTLKTAKSCSATLNATSPTVLASKLTPRSGTDYYVKIRGVNGNLVGDWSSLRGFNLASSTATTPPAAPTKPAKVSGVSVAAGKHSARLRWSAAKGAKSYSVCVMTLKTAKSCSATLKATSPTVLASKLTPRSGTDYYVKIRGVNGSLVGDWSSLRGFNLAVSASNAAKASLTVPSSGVFTLKGHGFGHGIGMSQYGAQGAARQGVKFDKILATYYPGTKIATKSGSIRVLLGHDSTDPVEVLGRSGLYFRNVSSGKRIALPTSVSGATVTRWQIVPNSSNRAQSALQYRTSGGWHSFQSTVWTGDGQFEGPTTVSLVLPSGATERYRGALRSAVPSKGSTSRSTVNILTIQDYVRGVVAAEMPASWAPEALKAQAVAARTYGVRLMTPSRYYDICNTTSCQVYGGVDRETTATNAAIDATNGKILTYGGVAALTQFSSSSGGFTAQGSQPYLKAATDPYDGWSGNPNHNWSQTIKSSTVHKAYPAIGTLKQIKIEKRSGAGRIDSVSLVGSKKSVTITGSDARWALGLKSNWFAF